MTTSPTTQRWRLPWPLLVPLLVLMGLWFYQATYVPRAWPVPNNEALPVSRDGQLFAVPAGKITRKIVSRTNIGGWNRLAIHRMQDNRTITTLPAWGARVVAYSADQQLVATGSDTLEVQLWHMHTGQLHATLSNPMPAHYPGAFNQLAFSPDGHWLAVGAQYNGVIRLWHVATGRLHYDFPGEVGAARAVAFSPDSQTLAVALDGVGIKLWQVHTRLLVQQVRIAGQPTSLAFSPDGTRLAIGFQASDRGRVEIWRLDGPAPVRERVFDTANWVYTVAFSPMGACSPRGDGPSPPGACRLFPRCSPLSRCTVSISGGWTRRGSARQCKAGPRRRTMSGI